MTIIAISKHGYEDANCSEQFTTSSILPKMKLRENKDSMLSPLTYGYKQGTINSSDTYDIRTLNQRRGFGNRQMFSNDPDRVYKQKTLSCVELNTSRAEYGSLRSATIEKQNVVEVEKKISEDMEEKILKEKQVYNEMGRIYGNPRPRIEKIKVLEGDKEQLSDKLIPSGSNYGETPEEIAEGLGYERWRTERLEELKRRIFGGDGRKPLYTPKLETSKSLGSSPLLLPQPKTEELLKLEFKQLGKQELLDKVPEQFKDIRYIINQSETPQQVRFFFDGTNRESWGEEILKNIGEYYIPKEDDFKKLRKIKNKLDQIEGKSGKSGKDERETPLQQLTIQDFFTNKKNINEPK